MALFRASDLVGLARLTRDLGTYLRAPVVTEQALRTVRDRLKTREERFLLIAEQAIYGDPRSPFLRLLRSAGCELGDLKALVAAEGLEGTLTCLVEAGVYVTFEEFKGRTEAVRGSQRFAFAEEDFDNPDLLPHFEVRSGGTRSPGTSVKIGLPFIADLAVATALALAAHDLTRHEHAIWLIAGVTPALLYAKLGRIPHCWFYPVRRVPLKARAGARYLAALSGLLGLPLPRPRFFDLQAPDRMADWLAHRLERVNSICLTTYASSAVRIANAAKEAGRPLTGVCFVTIGEPYTEAKKRVIQSAGARALVRYAFTEAGIIGYGCADPQVSDDVHLLSDCYALVRRERPVGDSGITVDGFLFTSLLPTAPKVLLNVESGDYGIVERRNCACALGAAGLSTHLARIRSFEKLSGEGMSFVQTNLLPVLEEVLPARFGGTGADYQLIEREGANGIPRLLLIVSPRVTAVDGARVREAFLEALGEGGGFDGLKADVLRRAGTVEVARRWPVATKVGKILPFHLVKGEGTRSVKETE